MDVLGTKMKPTIEEAVLEFRRKAAFLVMRGDVAGTKKLFIQYSADARATANKEEQSRAVTEMREALIEMLSAPSSKVRRGVFDDL